MTNRDRIKARDDLTLWQCPIPNHQLPICFVQKVRLRKEVLVDLFLNGSLKHLLRSITKDHTEHITRSFSRRLLMNRVCFVLRFRRERINDGQSGNCQNDSIQKVCS
jgi:hypothetical protein